MYSQWHHFDREEGTLNPSKFHRQFSTTILTATKRFPRQGRAETRACPATIGQNRLHRFVAIPRYRFNAFGYSAF